MIMIRIVDIKYNFTKYECQMVNNNGNRAYPQVKSGSVPLNAADYMDAIQTDPNSHVYLFSTSEEYTKNSDQRIHFIYKKELEDFIKKYRNTLPNLTYNWIDFCGFFD